MPSAPNWSRLNCTKPWKLCWKSHKPAQQWKIQQNLKLGAMRSQRNARKCWNTSDFLCAKRGQGSDSVMSVRWPRTREIHQTVLAPNVICNVNSNATLPPYPDIYIAKSANDWWGVWEILPFWLIFTIGSRWVWVYVATNVSCLNCLLCVTKYSSLHGFRIGPVCNTPEMWLWIFCLCTASLAAFLDLPQRALASLKKHPF